MTSNLLKTSRKPSKTFSAEPSRKWWKPRWMSILVMKSQNALTMRTTVTGINTNGSTAVMVPWKSRSHRTVNLPLSHRWSKNVRKIFPILTRKSSPCTPKEWPPGRFLKPLKISTGLRHQRVLFVMSRTRSSRRSKTGRTVLWMRYIPSFTLMPSTILSAITAWSGNWRPM